jgi:hypothetical protein
MRKKKSVVIVLLLLVCFAGMQLIRPKIDYPPVAAGFSAPPPVEAILRRACYNCHSNETKLAWFDKIVPAYWLVAGHVKDARKVLNFSEWGSLAPGNQKAELYEAVNMASLQYMPLASYKTVHPEAVITASEMGVLKEYLYTLAAPLPTSDSAAQASAFKQYESWIGFAPAAVAVKPGLNGVPYIPGYKNWQAISTTDRFDNGTMRVIYGNDIAVKAIKDGKINPWPNGTVFAKVAWWQIKDSSGFVHTGEFKQAELMIKDSEKYASTNGWGWGRWLGMDLKPYGKNALFTIECTNCHQPMKDNDFVFTTPLNTSR